jgi:hypothetical protein
MPPKMLTKMDLHGRVGVDDLEGGGHHVGVGAAADVEEVGRRAAALVDHVERAHGQPAPLAMMPTEPSRPM